MIYTNHNNFCFQGMLVLPGASFLANACASIAGTAAFGLITMKVLFRNYPKFPSSDIGTHPVAAVKGFRIKTTESKHFTVQFQLFYPCNVVKPEHERSKKLSENNTYMRCRALEGLCRTMGNNKLLRFILKCCLKNKASTHLQDGFAENIAVLDNSLSNDEISASENKYPIVVFSHGLFGSMEEYSTICSEIASLGFIVVAPEHEDGSASYAEKATCNQNTCESIENIQVVIDDGKSIWDLTNDTEEFFESYVIPYKTPKGVVYDEKSSVVEFRRPFLHQRYDEICNVLDALKQLALDTNDTKQMRDANCSTSTHNFSREKLKEILSVSSLNSNGDNSVVLAGHSFGGSTIQFVMHQLKEKSSKMLHDFNIKSLILLDPWVSPVSDDVLSQTFTIPTLNVFCEPFVTWTPKKVPHELEGVIKMLQANQNSKLHQKNNEHFQCVAIRGTKHQFFSDVPYWIPKCMSKYGGVSGKTNIMTSRSCMHKLIAKFILEKDTSQDFNLTSDEMRYVYNVEKAMLLPPTAPAKTIAQ